MTTQTPKRPISGLKDKLARVKKNNRKAQKEKELQDTVADAPPYEVLGLEGKNLALYSRERKSIVMLPASRLYADALFLQVAPSDVMRAWKEEWAELTDKQLTAAIRDDIATKVGSKVFDPAKVRGAGIWDDPEGTIYSTGRDCYLLKEGESQLHPVYPMRPDGTLYASVLGKAGMVAPGDTALTNEEGEAIYRLLEARAWAEPYAADVVAGWLICSQLGGIMPVRPHMWINGPRGCGKSELRKDMRCLFGPVCHTLAGTESTTAGIRRMLNGTALPVLYDESETDGDEVKVKRMQSALSMARLSFDGDQTSPQAKEGGGVQITSLTSCFALFSIRDFLESEADYNRFHRLHINHLPPTAVAELREKQKDGRALLHQKDLPARLMTRVVQQASFVVRNAQIIAERLEAAGIEGRRSKINAALLAGKWALIQGGEVTEEYRESCVTVAESAEKQARRDSRPEWEELLDTILSHHCLNHPMKMTIRQAVQCAFWPQDWKSCGDAEALRQQAYSALVSFGIHPRRVDKRRNDGRAGQWHVIIEHNSVAFKKILAASKWKGGHGLTTAVKGAPEAEVRVCTLDGRNTSRLLIYERAFLDNIDMDEQV